ncbi:MAG: excinuclease ABC subunit UvrA [Deltaproteobacteria bacterium]|nr:excinuclease ABC subunit UvrA [Deltaproteobacteria bacterium]
MPFDDIIIRGARQHNLKDIDLNIPREQFVVITGLSGSGKSTLAFDTLYAEGQRRYVESLSAYARQFLERMDKPDVDIIEGLSPAIAIEQKSTTKNPRSTVGTVTEIHDYLRVLFARVGQPHCHQCGRAITAQSVQQIVDQILALEQGTKVVILSPVVTQRGGSHKRLLDRLRRDGFARVQVDGTVVDLADDIRLDKNTKHTIEVVVDRLIVKDSIRNRLADSVELAMGLSDGLVTADIVGAPPLVFSEKAGCVTCGTSYAPFSPASFSFNSPQGACSGCNGLGSMMVFDPDLIVPDPERSLRQGAIVPWENRHSVYFFQVLDVITSRYRVDVHTPFSAFPEELKDLLLYGSKGETLTFYLERDGRRYTYARPFEGVVPGLERRYRETTDPKTREAIERFMNVQPCPRCGGARLRPESLAVTVGEQSIHDISKRCIKDLRVFFDHLTLTQRQQEISARILKEIGQRLTFLERVGLGYLTLDRGSSTLSSGEWQRIRLATQISSKLTGVMYVLDEPSIGLHQRDNRRLLKTIEKMRDLGNTVLVVEHDPETILAADHVIDMGPGAGTRGGHVVFAGPPSALVKDTKSITGQYLSGRRLIPVPPRRRPPKGFLTLTGARSNNLRNLTVRFPLGCFTCVTGVSGSGKSTLVIQTLYRALARCFNRSKRPVGAFQHINGLEHLDSVVHIDQSPIGRTPRSNPATYSGVFSDIRGLFAQTPDARIRGYRPGRFSFNVKGGRCESCRGDGIIKIEMHFLPDVYVTCDVCRGRRFNRETLDVRYKGKNIADTLNMTVNQALVFFGKISRLRNKLQTLADVGLGYIQLGQPATTLSGGEAQRLKLSRELSRRGSGRTVYILDEPTTGLHFADIQKLLDVLNRLTDAGNTVVVIEHNLDVIKSADHIIDLGPEGGDEGGRLVGCGTPEEISELSESHTGRFLRRVLADSRRQPMRRQLSEVNL